MLLLHDKKNKNKIFEKNYHEVQEFSFSRKSSGNDVLIISKSAVGL